MVIKMRNNFILLDGITLYVFLGIVFLFFFCGLVIVACSINQDKQMKKLQRENEKLGLECRVMKHQLGSKNSLINFLGFRISELEEEISIRDEAIAEALKKETK